MFSIRYILHHGYIIIIEDRQCYIKIYPSTGDNHTCSKYVSQSNSVALIEGWHSAPAYNNSSNKKV